MSLRFDVLDAAGLVAGMPALGALRVSVFKEFPYLYEGSEAYEREYLGTFAEAAHAIIVAARNEAGEIVGCATASALLSHHAEFSGPLSAAGVELSSTFYFGESVLLPAYRGRGAGHAFFDLREGHAKSRGFKRSCFCSVVREDDHPKKPAGYSSLDSFWQSRGYHKIPSLLTQFSWPEDPSGPSIPHPMNYWMREF